MNLYKNIAIIKKYVEIEIYEKWGNPLLSV
jgi:hypothetical protein